MRPIYGRKKRHKKKKSSTNFFVNSIFARLFHFAPGHQADPDRRQGSKKKTIHISLEWYVVGSPQSVESFIYTHTEWKYENAKRVVLPIVQLYELLGLFLVLSLHLQYLWIELQHIVELPSVSLTKKVCCVLHRCHFDVELSPRRAGVSFQTSTVRLSV